MHKLDLYNQRTPVRLIRSLILTYLQSYLFKSSTSDTEVRKRKFSCYMWNTEILITGLTSTKPYLNGWRALQQLQTFGQGVWHSTDKTMRWSTDALPVTQDLKIQEDELLTGTSPEEIKAVHRFTTNFSSLTATAKQVVIMPIREFRIKRAQKLRTNDYLIYCYVNIELEAWYFQNGVWAADVSQRCTFDISSLTLAHFRGSPAAMKN